jgi:hypothetical protein
VSDDQELDELIAEAEKRGFRVMRDTAWGYILWRIDTPINPHTDSNATLADLREMLEGIDWAREHGTIKDGWE